MRIGLPEAITPAILDLCSKLVPGTVPQFVAVTPPPGASLDNCFIEVEKQVRSHGGSALNGWAIWETPFVMLEAEAHSVWVDDTGAMHDITPKRFGFESVLFLPDPKLVYSDRQVATIFLPLRALECGSRSICRPAVVERDRQDRADVIYVRGWTTNTSFAGSGAC